MQWYRNYRYSRESLQLVVNGDLVQVAPVVPHLKPAKVVLVNIYLFYLIVKLRRGSGKDRQGMAPKAKGLKA